MLDLGLKRISRLVEASDLPWKAIHVAGTNGKGSVCAYAYSMLRAARIPTGMFTSPHLIDRWDCISFNGKPIEEDKFLEIEDKVKRKDSELDLKATEFELLTATAFEAFTQLKAEAAVIEVGLGGRLDATNIVEQPSATVVTKIGMDHESLLGNTLEAIAGEKAGILKRGIPCIIDATNPANVRRVIEEKAEAVSVSSVKYVHPDDDVYQRMIWELLPYKKYPDHQRMNIALAYEAVKALYGVDYRRVDQLGLAAAMGETVWPGRLQRLSIEPVTKREKEVLLDGAHNPQSILALASYISEHLRVPGRPVTWVFGASKGKNLKDMLHPLLEPGDNFVAVEFGQVDGMPWVQPTEAAELLRLARSTATLGDSHVGASVKDGLHWATNVAKGGPLVIAGSLYLVSDLFRLLRDA